MTCKHPEAHRMRFTNGIGERTTLCGVCAKNISALDNIEESDLFDPSDPTQVSNYWREGGGDREDDLDFEDI